MDEEDEDEEEKQFPKRKTCRERERVGTSKNQLAERSSVKERVKEREGSVLESTV